MFYENHTDAFFLISAGSESTASQKQNTAVHCLGAITHFYLLLGLELWFQTQSHCGNTHWLES